MRILIKSRYDRLEWRILFNKSIINCLMICITLNISIDYLSLLPFRWAVRWQLPPWTFSMSTLGRASTRQNSVASAAFVSGFASTCAVFVADRASPCAARCDLAEAAPTLVLLPRRRASRSRGEPRAGLSASRAPTGPTRPRTRFIRVRRAPPYRPARPITTDQLGWLPPDGPIPPTYGTPLLTTAATTVVAVFATAQQPKRRQQCVRWAANRRELVPFNDKGSFASFLRDDYECLSSKCRVQQWLALLLLCYNVVSVHYYMYILEYKHTIRTR